MTGLDIKQLRKHLRLSRARLGEMIGVVDTTIMRWENHGGEHVRLTDFYRTLLGVISSAAMKDDGLPDKIENAYIIGGPLRALHAAMKSHYAV